MSIYPGVLLLVSAVVYAVGIALDFSIMSAMCPFDMVTVLHVLEHFTEYFNPRYLNVLFHRVLEEAGLPHVRFHDLRHSAATLLREIGVDLKVIQTMLGHNNFMITANIYSYVFLPEQEEAMGKWDEKFKSGNKGEEQA